MKNFKLFSFTFVFLVFIFLFSLKFANIKKIFVSMKGNFSSDQKLTIRNKLASLLILNIHGTLLGKNSKEFLKKYKPGGIIIMSNNVYDIERLKKFISDIRKIYANHEDSINFLNPLIAIDQEGGRVRRIKHGITSFPSQMEAGKKGEQYVSEMSKIINTELRQIGINVNFAPVSDVLKNENNSVIGDRAFGRDENTVSKMVDSYIKSANKTGIISCAKHFPGHGMVSVDSHENLPVDISRLNNLLLKPFRTAIERNVPMIMPAHIIFKNIDNTNPATMSHKILTLLRNNLGFNGVIVSDDLSMGAINKNYKKSEVIIKSLKAGMDMFIHTAVKHKDHEALINETTELLMKDVKALLALERAIEKVRIMLENVRRNHY